MELVLQQTQKLNLVMTVELRQAIALLQYSTADLYDYLVEQEADNPLIELNENDSKISNDRMRRSGSDLKNPIDFAANKESSEREKLLEQVKWLDIEEDEQIILQYLVLNLDENGYMRLEEEEILSQTGANQELLERGINLLQKLEPIGVGARNLSECLVLQLRNDYPEEKITEKIILDHLDKLANKKWQEIAKALEISLSDVQAAFDLIRTLHPRPCNLNSKVVEYLNPDVIIEENEGNFDVYLNDSYLPEVRFNPQYTNILNMKGDQGKYIQDKYRSCKMLINSLEQRRNTILKVTQAIISKQCDFFNKGLSALKPLTLKDIADEIDMHESTVSRATADKIIQTPMGTFDIRVFFTSKLKSENGNSESQTKVKLMMEEFIRNENKYQPYSDQKIAEYFKTKKGITISRRTVAKYRNQLNILPSSKRKEIRV